MADIAPHDMGDVIDLDEAGAPVAAAGPADPDLVVLRDADEDALPPHAVQNDDGSVTLPLRYPVTLRFKRGDKITEEMHAELRMHRMTGADLNAIGAAADGSRIAVSVARSARMSELKFKPIFERMDASDARAAAEVVNHFFSNGPTTGR